MQQGGVSNLCLPLQSMAIIVEMYGNVGHSLCSLCSMLFSCSFLILTWHFRIADVLDEPQQAEQSRVTATYSLTYSLPAVPNDIQFSIEPTKVDSTSKHAAELSNGSIMTSAYTPCKLFARIFDHVGQCGDNLGYKLAWP